jgi:predicted 2-oxoglutarate/Fe(II)-dependent dioxygenase YbiX
MDKSLTFPLVQPNFLSSDVCSQLVNFCERSEDKFGSFAEDFWSGRFINLDRIHNPDIEQILLDTRQQMRSFLSDHLPTERPIYSEMLQLVRWVQGYQLEPHADQENPGGDVHPYPWRDFAGVLYLNDDYEGGSIHFPRQRLELRAEPGTLVTFPGTLDYLHGVREVTEGIRYTIACFFTYNEKYGDNLDQRFGTQTKIS